jgi:hypothetical protein
MATKTFKIGEYAKGGVITVETKGNLITVIGKDWDFTTGSRRSSDQSNAQEFTRESFNATHTTCYYNLTCFLNDLTTSYYTDQIIKWIETKIKITRSLRW